MYKEMSDSELLTKCKDDGSKWASAFKEYYPDGSQTPDEATMIGWFANAIEKSYDHRKNEKAR
jgi:hypothetical protein